MRSSWKHLDSPGVGVQQEAAREQRLKGARGDGPRVVVRVASQLPQPVVLLPHRPEIDVLQVSLAVREPLATGFGEVLNQHHSIVACTGTVQQRNA